MLAGGLVGTGVEKKVRPLDGFAPYAWIGGRPGRMVGGTDDEEADCNWTGLGEWARMTHPPRKLSRLAMPIQYRRTFRNSFIATSLSTDHADLALAVDLDQAMVLQVKQ